MKPNENEVPFIDDQVFTSTYDLVKFADSTGLTNKEFANYLKAKGYPPDHVIKLVQSYMNLYNKL